MTNYGMNNKISKTDDFWKIFHLNLLANGALNNTQVFIKYKLANFYFVRRKKSRKSNCQFDNINRYN